MSATKEDRRPPAKETTWTPIEEASTPPPWRPPAVLVGDIVWWYSHPASTDQPTMAFVTRINGDGSLCLSVLSAGAMMFATAGKQAVRFRHDPELTLDKVRDSGVWELRR